MCGYASSPRHKPISLLGLALAGLGGISRELILVLNLSRRSIATQLMIKDLKSHRLALSDNVTFDYDFIKCSVIIVCRKFSRGIRHHVLYHATANTHMHCTDTRTMTLTVCRH